jgi:hypothetical protein
MATLSFLVLAGALTASLAAMLGMIVPQWRRVIRLATGHADLAPLRTYPAGERRGMVAHRAATSAHVRVRRDRVAA